MDSVGLLFFIALAVVNIMVYIMVYKLYGI